MEPLNSFLIFCTAKPGTFVDIDFRNRYFSITNNCHGVTTGYQLYRVITLDLLGKPVKKFTPLLSL